MGHVMSAVNIERRLDDCADDWRNKMSAEVFLMHEASKEITRLKKDLAECRRVLQFARDKAHRQAGTDQNPFTYLWQKNWDKFEIDAQRAMIDTD